MFDDIKVLSKGLNASFKITIFLPDDYNRNDLYYKTLFIVGSSNPFLIPTYELEQKLVNRNMIGVAIYPNLDIKKNTLLFNTFNDKYGFCEIYESFIINELIPLLTKKYRIDSCKNNRIILGYKDTAILAYSLARHYPNSFGRILMYELNVESFKNSFLTDLISRFDPNEGLFFTMQDTTTAQEIENRLRMFGATSYKWCTNNIALLLENI